MFLNADVGDASQTGSSHLPYSDRADSPSIDDRESKSFENMMNARETARLGFEFCLLLVGWHSVVIAWMVY